LHGIAKERGINDSLRLVSRYFTNDKSVGSAEDEHIQRRAPRQRKFIRIIRHQLILSFASGASSGNM
jgi:hypothetical protein